MNVIATVSIPAGTFGPDEPMVLTISKAGATPPAPAQGEAALGRAEPVAWHGTWQTRTSKWTEVFETEAQATNWAINKEGAVINPLFFSATPPAAQPALALSEDDLKQLVLDALEKKLEAVNIGPYGMHKGDWRQLRRREIADAVAAALAKRFKGE